MTTQQHLISAEEYTRLAEMYALGDIAQAMPFVWLAIMHGVVALARLQYAAAEKSDPPAAVTEPSGETPPA